MVKSCGGGCCEKRPDTFVRSLLLLRKGVVDGVWRGGGVLGGVLVPGLVQDNSALWHVVWGWRGATEELEDGVLTLDQKVEQRK